MTKIEEMLVEHCPNGVEWYKLGEVCLIANSNRKPVKANLRIAGDIPYYGANNIQDYVQGYTHDGEYVLIAEDGSASLENYSIQWVSGKFWANNHVHVVHGKDILNNRFLYHCLKKLNFAPFLSGGGRAKLTKAKLLELPIPIPPLEIQQKIVQILDKFTKYVTELTAELTAELTFRKQQYSYYRDKLLSFEDDVYQVEWKTLGEVATFRRGSFPQPYTDKSFYGGENAQPFVQVVDVSDDGFRLNQKTRKTISQKATPKSVFVPKGTVIVTLQGTLGRVAITQYDAYVDRTLAIFESYKEEINKHYFAHQLKFIFDIKKVSARGSTLKTITKEEFSKFQIPLPPLHIQSRIVQVLDNFDTVCNDLKIGLPKEIALRQKQYEFFREKLLTFTAEGVYADSGQWTVEWAQTDLIKLLQWVFGVIRVKLGAIADISRGKRVVRKELSNDTGYPVYQNSLTALGYYEKFNTTSNTTFIVSAGAAGEIGFSYENFWKADDVWTLETASIEQRFLYHILQNQHGQIKSQVRKASIPRLSKISIENLIVSLPSLSEQRNITFVLDTFDTLTSDLTKGLPKEIEQRQKQYEYFRDRLLRF